MYETEELLQRKQNMHFKRLRGGRLNHILAAQQWLLIYLRSFITFGISVKNSENWTSVLMFLRGICCTIMHPPATWLTCILLFQVAGVGETSMSCLHVRKHLTVHSRSSLFPILCRNERKMILYYVLFCETRYSEYFNVCAICSINWCLVYYVVVYVTNMCGDVVLYLGIKNSLTPFLMIVQSRESHENKSEWKCNAAIFGFLQPNFIVCV